MNKYEFFLNKEIKKKNTFVLTAENLLAIRNLDKEKIFDVGICEQSLIGIAAGISKMGGKCYVHALSNFLLSRAYEFIKIDLDYNNCPCVLVGSMGGIHSTLNGPTHQAIDEIHVLENFNFDVFFPFSVDEMVRVLEKFNFKNSLYVRYNPASDVEVSIKNNDITNNFLIGSGKILIVSYGIIAHKIFKLMNNNSILKKKYKLFNLSYLQKNKIKNNFIHFLKFKKIVVVEDHLENGSIYSKLISFLKEKNKKNYKVKPINLGKKYFGADIEIDNIFNNMGINEENLTKLKI
jgi:transketolase